MPSERRAGLPPPLPHPLLVITGPRGFACVRADALVADEESIDAALHAARAAGTVEDTVAHIKWCVASAPCGRTAALLRACGFVPLPGAADTTADPCKP
ncbi:MAG: hypothetical protein HMLKMBBP_00154 [Planctomycetes bacterium]|nr:hypothetical protein [Planctomycetota bacterium]